MLSKEISSILQFAVENTEYSVVVTSGDLEQPGPFIVYVNSAFTRMTGYTSEEILNSSPRILQGPATDPHVLAEMKAALRKGESFEGCTWNYAKDGSPYQVEWTVTPVCEDGKVPDYFFSIQRNVTESYRSYAELKSQTRKLESLLQLVGANRDGVTGACNYRGMLERLQKLVNNLGNPHSAVAVLALKLSSMNRIHQVFGTDSVNQFLKVVADRLTSQLEITETLTHCHEYCFEVLIPVDIDSMFEAELYLMERAQTLIAAITEESIEIDHELLGTNVGAGIARSPVDGHDCKKLMTLAIEAAQRATEKNSGSVCWADHANAETQLQQIRLENKLLRAITEQEIVAFYQPILDLGSNTVVGAEVLARWPQPDGHPAISPDQFIPLAEKLGIIDQLGIQIFEEACRQLNCWQALPGNEAFWVSVNVAPAQLRDPHLADRFSAITQAIGVSPTNVKLEITESALEYGLDGVIEVINKLATAGFLLALDDFGTGHSSLQRLIEIPFNILKADKCFVAQLPNGKGAAVVSSLSQLSGHLSIDALGEGVETAVQENFLRECNYRYAQGFYYAKPMAADDFSNWAGWSRKSI